MATWKPIDLGPMVKGGTRDSRGFVSSPLEHVHITSSYRALGSIQMVLGFALVLTWHRVPQVHVVAHLQCPMAVLQVSAGAGQV